MNIEESDIIKKRMVLYIDCVERRTFVTELQKTNKVGEDESNVDVKIEVDIDIVE